MKLLIGYRYGILGGVCTQLFSRFAGWSGPAPTFGFCELHGAESMLAPIGRVAAMTPEQFRAAATDHDLVVVIDTPEYLDALEDSDRPVLLEVHTTTERGLSYLSGRSWFGHRVVVPSEASARLLRGQHGVSGPIEVVGNVVDTTAFRPLEARGRVPRVPILAWVGKIDPHKNWEGFLEIASLLAREERSFEAWVVGGYTAPESQARALLETSAALGLSDRLRWLPEVPYASMPAFHAAVRASGGLCIATTRNESFGMSVAEALACGVPAVVPSVGALPELANAPYLALYPEGDLGVAVESVLKLWPGSLERSEADCLLELERASLVARWSAETIQARYRDVLEAMVSREKASP